MDARCDLFVALRVRPSLQFVLADASEPRRERVPRSGAPEESRDPDGVRRKLVELRVQLTLAALAPEVPPLVCAARSQRANRYSLQPAPIGRSVKAPLPGASGVTVKR